MNRTLISLVGAAILIACASAQDEYSKSSNLLSDFDSEADGDSRLFLSTTNTTSVTIGYNSFVLGIVGTLALLSLLALALFYAAGAEDQSYGESGYADYSSGYSRKSSFDPYAIDWEKFNIIDWISIGEEAWRKFNPSDLDCQKRLICEVHQNTTKFGAAAARMVDLFSYLQYAEVLSLPDEFKALVEEYLDAADRGRSLQKDCGELYDSCDFSVKKMVDKYNHNEI